MTEGPFPLELVSVLFEPFLSWSSRTHWFALLVTAGIAVLWYWRSNSSLTNAIKTALTSKSSWLDIQLWLGRQLLRVVVGTPVLVTAWWFSTHLIRWMDAELGQPNLEWSPTLVTALYSLTLFVVWDLSRFMLHWCFHNIGLLWNFHQVHHSATVLTPMTFHRIHPVESWLYEFRYVLSTGITAALFYWLFRDGFSNWTMFGVPTIGLLCNVLMGNLRHSHMWIRFPEGVEKWLISPAHHQLHHSADPAFQSCNYGTWLAVWDRLLGSLKMTDHPPQEYGVPATELNHRFSLISAWFGPVFAALKSSKKTSLAAAALVLLSSVATAEEPSTESSDESTDSSAPGKKSPDVPDSDEAEAARFGERMIVEDDEAVHIAGSAHRVDEQTMELFDYNDIQQILGQIPGVVARGEDGFGLRPNIGIRGANSDRSAKITLLEDGLPLSPAPYAAPAAYYFPLSTRLVGVEVFKGPSAIKSGPQTIGGTLNVLTRAVPTRSETQLELAGGLYGSFKGHGWAALGSTDRGILLEAVHLRSDGFKELDTGGPTGFERSDVMLKSFWIPVVRNRLELKLGYGHERSDETYLGLSVDDFNANPLRRYSSSSMGLMEWNRTQAELAWDSRWGKPSSSWTARTVLYHRWFHRKWHKLNGFRDSKDLHKLLSTEDVGGAALSYLGVLRGELDSNDPNQWLMVGTNDRQFQNLGLQSNLLWEHTAASWSSTLETGFRIHSDSVQRLHTQAPFAMQDGVLSTPEAPGEDAGLETTLDSDAGALGLSAYVHEDLQLGRWHLFPSFRVEQIRTFRVDQPQDGSELTIEDPQWRTVPLPGIGLLFELDDWSNVFAGAYRGFSPVAPGQQEDVEPELAWNTEFGVRSTQDFLQAEAIGYTNVIRNLVGQCTMSSGCLGDDLDRQFNGGSALIYGAELLLGTTVPLTPSWMLPISTTYTWTEANFTTDFNSSFPQFGRVSAGDWLPYLARHRAQAQLGVAHDKGELRISASYRSKMLDAAGDLESDLSVPSLLLFDLVGNVELLDTWALTLQATNLTNQLQTVSYRPFGARPNAPRQVLLGLRWRPGK